MKPKMRIQLCNKDGIILSDRLVDQLTELTMGPKDKHKDPYNLECTIQTEDDILLIINYLNQLRGKVPIKKKQSKQLSSSKINPYKDVYHHVKKLESIEQVVKYLDELDFKFITRQFLEELISIGKIKPYKSEDKNLFMGSLSKTKTYMARLYRKAIEPQNDRYDFKMLFGIDVFKYNNGVTIFRDLKFFKELKITWAEEHKFDLKKKKKPMKFPDYMSIDDRKKWRALNRKTELNRPLGPREEDFYERYKIDINKLNK